MFLWYADPNFKSCILQLRGYKRGVWATKTDRKLWEGNRRSWKGGKRTYGTQKQEGREIPGDEVDMEGKRRQKHLGWKCQNGTYLILLCMMTKIWLTSNGLRTCSLLWIPESSIVIGHTNNDSNNSIQLLFTCFKKKSSLLAIKLVLAVRKNSDRQRECT